MSIFKMEVNEKVNGAYKLLGTVDVTMFTLAAFGIEDACVVSDKGAVSYTDAKLQYLQDSLSAAVKAAARNKLVSGTVTLKDGNTIATTVEELIAKNERNGEALALHREFLTAFTAYLATVSGKSAAVQTLYSGMVRAKATIALATEARRNGLVAQLEAFLENASAEQAEKFAAILTGLAAACEGAVDLDDDEL